MSARTRLIGMAVVGALGAFSDAPAEDAAEFGSRFDSLQFGLVTVLDDGSPEFHETREIPLIAGTTFGWAFPVSTVDSVVTWSEVYVYTDDEGHSSTVRTTRFTRQVEEEWIGNVLRVETSDSPGLHLIRVFANERLLQEFAFQILAGPFPGDLGPVGYRSVGGEEWAIHEASRVRGAIVGNFTPGAVLETSSGNSYEVREGVFNAATLYDPEVLILRRAGECKLIIQGIYNEVLCSLLSPDAVPSTGDSEDEFPVVTESYIRGTFHGFDHGNRYEFDNGDVWEQVDPRHEATAMLHPRVVVYHALGEFRMRVTGMARTVRVRRVK